MIPYIPQSQNPKGSLKVSALLASLALFASIQASTAQLTSPVGVEFLGRTSTGSNPGTPGVAQSDVAGVVAQPGWNIVDNSYGYTPANVGETPPLLDTNNATTTVTLAFNGNDSWNNDVDPNTITTPNAKLMNGTIKSNGSDGISENFQFNNVPDGTYDLYVYINVDGDQWEADVSDNDNVTTYYINQWHQFYDTNTFVQAKNTNPSGPRDTGNYVKFSNLGTYGRGSLGAYVTKRGPVGNGTGVPAIQLVPVGPPQANTISLSLLLEPISRRGADGTNNVTFTAKVKGPAFYKQWLQNGAPIAGATNFSYTPDPISLATMQNAKISFTASNNLNSVTTSNAVLTVGHLITVNGVVVIDGGIVNITTQPQSTTKIAVRSGPATFTVAATSGYIGDVSGAAPPINYQWQSAPKGSSTFTDIAGATKSTYRTPTVLQSDDGTQFRAAVTASDATVNSSIAVLTVLPNTNPPVATAGSLVKNDGTVQVGVTFDELVDPATVIQANFALSAGSITAFRLSTNSYTNYVSAVLTATGLTPGSSYTVTAHGVTDLSGNVLPSTNLSFSVPVEMKWAEIGVPPVPGQVIPVGKDGFDILNGGRQEWNSYEEVDMAYVKKTNDFDVKIQVIYAEPGSEWTRVGLQARNALDAGIPSDANGQSINSTNHLFSAYAQTHVNPNQTLGSSGQWDPSDPVQPGNTTPNNSHEQNQRLTAGAATTSWGSPSGKAIDMDYPDIWLRLARQGSQLHGYRSTDGVTWTDQGTTKLTDQQPDMYVGPFLAVETGNIWAAADFNVWTNSYNPTYDRLFIAQFRNFGDVSSATPGPAITIKQTSGTITITFTGTKLQQSPTVGSTATWTTVTGATSPYTVPKTAAATFYRSQQ
jgi:hypothetical protein